MFVEMLNYNRKEADEMRRIIELCSEVIMKLQLTCSRIAVISISVFTSTKLWSEKLKHFIVVIAIEALTRIVLPLSTVKKSPEWEAMMVTKCKSHSLVLM